MLTALVLGAIKPARTVGQNSVEGQRNPKLIDNGLQIVLAGYTYPALKAKKLKWRIPNTDWDKVKSRFTVSLQGPAGAEEYAGGRYSVNAVFELKPTGLNESWVQFDPKNRQGMESPVLAVPAHTSLVLTTSLLETSNFKKTLEALAREVTALPKEISFD